MSIRRSACLALTAAACVGFAQFGLAQSVFALDAPHHSGYQVKFHSAASHHKSFRPVATVRTVGAPIATQTRAEVLYVVPVIPTLLGIRPAPVGQPVIYVIDQPGERSTQRHHRNSDAASELESGPRVLRMEP
jgi:hypothetical protein